MVKTCKTCQVYEAKGGECRRYAPRANPNPLHVQVGRQKEEIKLCCGTAWPKVKPTDWCGQWSDGEHDFYSAPRADFEKKAAARKKF